MTTTPAKSPQYELRVGQWVRAERTARGATLEEVATYLSASGCKIDKGGVSRLERGQRQISVNEAGLLARYFGLALSDMVRPMSLVRSADAKALYERYLKAWERAQTAKQVLAEIRADLLEMADDGFKGEVLAAIDELASDRELETPLGSTPEFRLATMYLQQHDTDGFYRTLGIDPEAVARVQDSELGEEEA